MSTKKKVLFVATVAGHIRSFHLPYLKLLKENGYETYVACAWNLDKDYQLPYCDHFIEIPIKRSPLKADNLKAIKMLKEYIEKEKFDIIHCHTPMGSVVARLAAKDARKNGTRVIYTCHGFHFYKGAPIINWLVYYPVEWYLAKYTDTIVTINKEDYELAKNKFRNRCHSFEYIPGIGVNPEKFDVVVDDVRKKEIRESLGIKEDCFVMIYPARLCKDKNQILLLELMKRIKEKNACLLLPGSDEYNGYYQTFIENNHLQNVKLLGRRDDIPCLLKASDLLVATSIREGFGLNLVEALICGLPVIAVDNRGHREIVQEGINGFLIQNDINELEEKFNRVYNDKEMYKAIKNNCRASAEKFLLTNSVKVMKEIYGIK